MSSDIEDPPPLGASPPGGSIYIGELNAALSTIKKLAADAQQAKQGQQVNFDEFTTEIEIFNLLEEQQHSHSFNVTLQNTIFIFLYYFFTCICLYI